MYHGLSTRQNHDKAYKRNNYVIQHHILSNGDMDSHLCKQYDQDELNDYNDWGNWDDTDNCYYWDHCDNCDGQGD